MVHSPSPLCVSPPAALASFAGLGTAPFFGPPPAEIASNLRTQLDHVKRALGDDDEEADRQYIRLFGLQEYQRIGAPYGLAYAEAFYYMPPGGTFTGAMSGADIEAYIAKHAEDLP